MSTILSLPVIETSVLPITPTVGEWARRYVRHGMADVLAWLGEEVGPEPDEKTHVIQTPDALFVSPAMFKRLSSR